MRTSSQSKGIVTGTGSTAKSGSSVLVSKGSEKSTRQQRRPPAHAQTEHVLRAIEVNQKKKRENILLKTKAIEFSPGSVYVMIKESFPLHPKGERKELWDFLLLLLVVYNCLLVPVDIAFETEMDRAALLAINVINVVVDLMFMGDIGLSFNTMYFDDNNELIQVCLSTHMIESNRDLHVSK